MINMSLAGVGSAEWMELIFSIQSFSLGISEFMCCGNLSWYITSIVSCYGKILLESSDEFNDVDRFDEM